METEFEAKFFPIDKEEFRETLRKVGAKLIIPERKMRRAIADRRTNPWMKSDHIRVRDEGNVIRLSVKIHAKEDGKLTDQKESSIEVQDFESTIDLLKAAGIVFNHYVENLRETWEFDGAEIYIDTWPGVEPGLEIEAGSEEKVKQVAARLGFDWRQKIITPMPETYAKVYKIDIEGVLNKMTNLTFENNPFKGLKRF